LLESLVNQLKIKGYYLDGAAIAYYSTLYQIYICCATDPVPRSCTIPAAEFENLQNGIIIRAKLATFMQDNGNNSSSQNVSEPKEGKRPKERKISFVISKVLEWRKLYQGIIDDNGQIVRYSLEEAAEKVGVSKKSLDDYMLQLRLGSKYKFDFQKHKDDKVGVLRSFIKAKRNEEKAIRGEVIAGDEENMNSHDEENYDSEESEEKQVKPKGKRGRKKKNIAE